MRDLNFELADYNGRKYIKYRYTDTDNKVCEDYTNMEYVVVDVKCEKFIEIMSKTGGFVANMTTRLFEKEKLDVYYMMLVAIPQATNSFLFNFVYLDKNKQLLKCYKDSDCMDYIYFRKKFESCTVSRGSVYDLDFDFLKNQISSNVTTDFNLVIEGRPVTKEDTIIFNDSSICLHEYEKDDVKKRGIEIDHFEFNLDFSNYNTVLKGVAITQLGKTVKDYELDSKYQDVMTDGDYINRKQAELKEFYGYDVDFEIKPKVHEFRISLDFARIFSDKLSYKKV